MEMCIFGVTERERVCMFVRACVYFAYLNKKKEETKKKICGDGVTSFHVLPPGVASSGASIEPEILYKGLF